MYIVHLNHAWHFGSKFSFIPSIQYLDFPCLDIMVLLVMHIYGTCICVRQLTLCFKPFYLGENSSWKNSTSKEELWAYFAKDHRYLYEDTLIFMSGLGSLWNEKREFQFSSYYCWICLGLIFCKCKGFLCCLCRLVIWLCHSYVEIYYLVYFADMKCHICLCKGLWPKSKGQCWFCIFILQSFGLIALPFANC